jgi:hypothetical protein
MMIMKKRKKKKKKKVGRRNAIKDGRQPQKERK